MTDVREIISNALARAKHDDHPNWTGFIMNQLDRAGYRILSGADLQARDDALLERAAEKIHDEWVVRKGLNCTFVCAIVRSLKGGRS